jgi:Tfp pilus assembly protein PilX
MKSMSSMKKDERGMASILVTMIMIIVITLIVIGFAQVARRNQREALDNQLSTQAYYAAESGVNAAVNYLSANPNYSTNTMGNCKSFIANTLGSGANILNSGTNTQYSCLMVDPDPNSLNVAPVTQGSATVLHIKDAGGHALTALRIQWSEQTNSNFPDTNPANNCNSAANGALPAYDAWKCPYGIVRMDLVNGANVSNTTLENNESVTSLYMVPSYQSGSPYTTKIAMSSTPGWQPVDPTAAPNAACDSNPSDPLSPANDVTCPVRVVHVQCSLANGCSLELDISGGSSEYYARLTMMYQDSSSVTLTGADSVSGLGSVNFVGGQAVIDSTGQSQDELRRIEVRVPIVSAANANSGSDALQTTDSICKRLTINSTSPGTTATDSCTDR